MNFFITLVFLLAAPIMWKSLLPYLQATFQMSEWRASSWGWQTVYRKSIRKYMSICRQPHVLSAISFSFPL